MSRFYVKPEDVKGDLINVSREEAHHIVDVMRLSSGDAIVAFDGTGREYSGKIIDVSKNGLRIKIESKNEVKTKKKVSITLVQSLPKGGKMDLIVEKAAELGVDDIIPLVTERTIVHLDEERRAKKRQHWQTIAVSASKQCGRTRIPKIHPVLKFKDALAEVKKYDLALMACLSKSSKPLKECISRSKAKRVLAMIGPEGDFSPEEIKLAKSAGVKLVSFGRLVLRVDTAAIFMLSVVNYVCAARQ